MEVKQQAPGCKSIIFQTAPRAGAFLEAIREINWSWQAGNAVNNFLNPNSSCPVGTNA
jgi:hypothetical protein